MGSDRIEQHKSHGQVGAPSFGTSHVRIHWPLRTYENLHFWRGPWWKVQKHGRSQNTQDCYTDTHTLICISNGRDTLSLGGWGREAFEGIGSADGGSDSGGTIKVLPQTTNRCGHPKRQCTFHLGHIHNCDCTARCVLLVCCVRIKFP